MADIDEQRARLKRLLRGRDDKTLRQRPPNGSWSVLENVRHLLFAEQLHLGGFQSQGVEWSPLGMSGKAGKLARIGKQPVRDIAEVIAAWDDLHRPISRTMRSVTGALAEKALWRNYRHLRIHTDIIERLLRRMDG